MGLILKIVEILLLLIKLLLGKEDDDMALQPVVLAKQELMSNLDGVQGDTIDEVSPKFNFQLDSKINMVVLYQRDASSFGQPIRRIEIDPSTFVATVSVEDEGWHNAAVGSAPAGQAFMRPHPSLNDKMYMIACSAGSASSCCANPYITAYDLQNGVGPVEQEGNDATRKHLQIDSYGNICGAGDVAMAVMENGDIMTFHNNDFIFGPPHSRYNLMTVAGATTFTIVDPDNASVDEPLSASGTAYAMEATSNNNAALARVTFTTPSINVRNITRSGAAFTGESADLSIADPGEPVASQHYMRPIGNNRVLILGGDTIHMVEIPTGGGTPTLIASADTPLVPDSWKGSNRGSTGGFAVDPNTGVGLIIEKRNRIDETPPGFADQKFYGVRFTFDPFAGTLSVPTTKATLSGPEATFSGFVPIWVHHLSGDNYGLFWYESGDAGSDDILHYWRIGFGEGKTRFYFGTDGLANERTIQ